MGKGNLHGGIPDAARISASTLSSPRIAVAWTPDSRVIYNDPGDGYRDIWRMDADGANPQRLTSSPSNKDELVLTRDGRYIVYQQDPHIWRLNSDGTDPKQLTHGRLDVHPEVGPDGKSVVYASFADWAPGIGGERIGIDRASSWGPIVYSSTVWRRLRSVVSQVQVRQSIFIEIYLTIGYISNTECYIGWRSFA